MWCIHESQLRTLSFKSAVLILGMRSLLLALDVLAHGFLLSLLGPIINHVNSLDSFVSLEANQPNHDGRDRNPNTNHCDDPRLTFLIGSTLVVDAAEVTIQVATSTYPTMTQLPVFA